MSNISYDDALRAYLGAGPKDEVKMDSWAHDTGECPTCGSLPEIEVDFWVNGKRVKTVEDADFATLLAEILEAANMPSNETIQQVDNSKENR